MPRCDTCPVPVHLTCQGEPEAFKRLCFLAATRTDYRRQVVINAHVLADGKEGERGGWQAHERTADDRLTARIISNVCQVRESTCNCLDKPALCSRSGTPVLVSLARCKACPSITGIT